jgi:hypothetical protein
MVYLAKKNGAVVHHTDLGAMKALDGIDKPDMEVTDAEFEAAGGLARIINGKIFLGKTAEEKASEKTAADNAARLKFLKQQLADTDYIAAKIAEGAATKEQYSAKIAERQTWRDEINVLEPKN